MLTKLLSTDQDELLREERKVLARLKGALVRFNASAEHQSALDRSIEQLDELFLLVIVGEFNSGKSAFINALVGASVAQEGVTPTTAQINVLQYGETATCRHAPLRARQPRQGARLEVGAGGGMGRRGQWRVCQPGLERLKGIKYSGNALVAAGASWRAF